MDNLHRQGRHCVAPTRFYLDAEPTGDHLLNARPHVKHFTNRPVTDKATRLRICEVFHDPSRTTGRHLFIALPRGNCSLTRLFAGNRMLDFVSVTVVGNLAN